MTDITREAVETLAGDLRRERVWFYGTGPTTPTTPTTPSDTAKATLLALRDALDKAELELEDRSLTSAEQALRAVKAERERDEWRTTAQKNAREAGRYMGLLDEVLEALVPFVQFNTSEAVLSITVPSSAVTAARAILAKHGGGRD